MEDPDRQDTHPSKGVILVTDDNPNNIRILYGMLEEEGFLVRVALDGNQAIESIAADKPDLLLLDINMPGMNGYDVCRTLKASEDTAHIPVIFISALDSPFDKVTAFSCGGVDYITKPFQINEVMARVATHLRLHKLQMELENLVAERTLELQKALQQLGIAHKRLELLNQTKSEFLSMISHEMRTPLNGILGLADLVMDEGIDNETIREIKPMYAQAKKRMLDLLTDSANLDQLEIAAGEVVCSRLPASKLIDSFRDGLDPSKFKVEFPPSDETEIQRCLYLDEIPVLRGLHTVAEMSDLCRGSETIKITARCTHDKLLFVFPLLHCEEPTEKLHEIFRLNSATRNQSQFDPLGLSPVVAIKTLSLFEGTLDIRQASPNSAPEICVALPFENQPKQEAESSPISE